MEATPLTAERLLAHEPFVRSLARRLLADEHDAQDLVQETWLRALGAPARPLANPRAWLARIVRNLAADRRRGDDARAARERGEAPEEPSESVADSIARLETQGGARRIGSRGVDQARLMNSISSEGSQRVDIAQITSLRSVGSMSSSTTTTQRPARPIRTTTGSRLE